MFIPDPVKRAEALEWWDYQNDEGKRDIIREFSGVDVLRWMCRTIHNLDFPQAIAADWIAAHGNYPPQWPLPEGQAMRWGKWLRLVVHYMARHEEYSAFFDADDLPSNEAARRMLRALLWRWVAGWPPDRALNKDRFCSVQLSFFEPSRAA